MHLSQNLLFGKRKYLFALLLLSFIYVIYSFYSKTNNDDFDNSRREILLRRVGHELLLKSGDSTSRVLPIIKKSENEFEIGFEKALTFQTGSLVNITQQLFAKDSFASDYVVNVLDCNNSSVVYGYAMSKNKKQDIVTCIGRKQPVACYIINIKFKPDGSTTTSTKYFLGGLFLFAIVGVVYLRTVKPRSSLPESNATDRFNLGSVVFDAKNRKLLINRETIDLTATETRVLLIFALSPNAIIERSQLQKEIWEDEGVIVGRSLDMFISKLRKKLESDPNIKIVVIRGKGYKLEIGS